MLAAKKSFEERLSHKGEKRSLPVTPLAVSPSKKRPRVCLDDESPMIQVK